MPTHNEQDGQILRRLLRIASPYLGLVVLIFFLGLLAAPLTLLLPIPLKIVVDSVIDEMPLPKTISFLIPTAVAESRSALLLFAVIMQVLVVLLLHCQQVVMHILQTFTGKKLILKLRQKLFGHIQRLSFAFHDARGTGDSIYRIQYDATSIEQILVYGSVAFLSSFVTLFAMIYVIMKLNVQLAFIALAVVPVLYAISKRFSTRMRSKYKQVKKMESHVLSIVQEVMGAFRVVKAFNREATEERRFSTQAEDTIKLHMSLAFAESSYGLLVNCTVALGSAAVLYVGVHNIMAGTLSIGELLMVLTYLTQLYNPLKTISKKLAALQKSMASAQRAFELLDEDPDVKDKPDAVEIKRARGEIVFNHLRFSYDGRTDILKDISLRIKAGTRLGIAGETGAGKTTLVSLLPRFYDPTEGSIFLDGRDIREYKLNDLRNQFSIVLQEPVLFATTIRENIAYARPETTQQDIEAAATAANAHDFITALPDGYDTVVGERGMLLSGGERQRISLARAFLKDAPILIMDEPTSSVDVLTEGLIMEAMERLMKSRTTFMIAHRLSTLDNCDQRIEIDQGSIVDAQLESLSRAPS